MNFDLRNCKLVQPTSATHTRLPLPLVTLPYALYRDHYRDVRGRRRSACTEPGYRKGQSPANKGIRYKTTHLTLEEVDLIIEAHKRPGQTIKHERLGQRNAALVAALHRSGLRVHEGLLLKPGDVDFDKHVVHVRRGKGGKERWSIIDDSALDEIRAWLQMREELGFTDEDFLFCVIEGPTRGGPMSQPYVRTKLKEAAALAGVDKRVTCHQLRHGHARHLRKMGVSLEAVQQQLGHSNVATTSIYVSVLESGDIEGGNDSSPRTSPASPAIPTSPHSTPASLSPLTCSSAGPPAKTSPSPASERDSTENDPACSGTTAASATPSASNGASGRTWQGLCPPTRVWTSHQSWAPSWAPMSLFPPTDGRAQVWLPDRGEAPAGGSWTLNTSECPNAAVESSLSDILEAHVHPRFFLSPRAATGILRRAENRDTALPRHLQEALAALASANPDDAKKTTRTSSPEPSLDESAKESIATEAGCPSLPTPFAALASTPARTAPDEEPRSQSIDAFYSTESHSSGNNVDICPTLKVGSGLGIPSPPAVRIPHVANTLSTKNEMASSSTTRQQWYEDAAALFGTVRRLTPTECERLMDWPDGWTWLA